VRCYTAILIERCIAFCYSVFMHSQLKKQFLLFTLTACAFILVSFLLFFFITLINHVPNKSPISLILRLVDIGVGITIYLKTAIDFAIFTGNLISDNKNLQGKIAISLGTTMGNGIGTLLILAIWFFFKEIPLLLAAMVILAALVLLSMAEEGFETLLETREKKARHLRALLFFLSKLLHKCNIFFSPIVKIILPEKNIATTTLPFKKLIAFSFLIPFILGLDDFAGYVPLFSVINVFGFCLGVFLAHLVLTSFMFISVEKTTNIVRSQLVIFIGSLAFLTIAVFGIWEVIHMFSILLVDK